MTDNEQPKLEDQRATGEVDEQQGEADEDKLDCVVNVEDSGVWKKKICVEIPRREIDKELNEQYGEFTKTAQVPGFRKGRAPRRLVEKRHGADISSQTKLRLLGRVFEQIDEKDNFEILGEPDFDPEKIELPEQGDMKFDYEVEVKPQFDLPELEGIRLETRIYEVTKERIDEALLQLRRRGGEIVEVADGAAEEDDMIKADVTMTVEGIAEPETAEDIPLRVSSAAVMGVLVEDLGTVLAGSEIGSTKTCSAQVSDTHPKEEYRNKKADFKITVKSIERLVPAEIDEKFLSTLGMGDVEELRNRIEQDLEDQADRQQRNMMRQQVHDYLDKNVQFELPAEAAARYAVRVLQRRYYDLAMQGVPQDRIEENLEKLRAASSEQAGQELKMSFVMDAVADKLEVEVTEAEVNGSISQIAGRYDRRPERVREQMQREGRLDSLRRQIRHDKAIDQIMERVEVVDAPAASEQTAPEEPKKVRRKWGKKADKADEAAAAQNTVAEERSGEEAKTLSNRRAQKRTPPA